MTLPEIFAVLGVLTLAAICWFASFVRSRRLLENWASEGGLNVERRELHFLGRGPFDWVSRTQFLHAVRLRDKEGRVRDAWVKCGHAVFGMFSRRLDVKWVDAGKSAFMDV